MSSAPFRARMFVRVARLSALLPAFRGKARLFLALYRLMKLQGKHIVVETSLTRPVRYRARLDLNSWLQRIAFLTGGYEAETARFLARVHATVNPTGRLLDIGANVGLLSIPLARLLGGSRLASSPPGPLVVSVEAVAANAEALRRNVELNGLAAQVRVVEAALGEAVGDVEVKVEGNLEDRQGTGTAHVIARNSSARCARIPLRLTTLDDLLASGTLDDHCTVVKIDTDGYDLKILQGGAEFLRRVRPVVFGEFSAHCLRWHGQTVSDVFDLAVGIGYQVWVRDDRKAWTFTSTVDTRLFVQDLLLVPEERARLLSWCLDGCREE